MFHQPKYLIGFIICSDIKGSRKNSFQDKTSRSLYVQLQKKGVSEENNTEILGPRPFYFFVFVFLNSRKGFFLFVCFLILHFIYLFIFGCVGSSFLCEGFL